MVLGVAAGDSVHVELTPGTPTEEPAAEPAPVTCPELEAAVESDATFGKAWSALPEDHRAEYGRWISGGVSKPERQARVDRLRHRLTAPDHGAGTSS